MAQEILNAIPHVIKNWMPATIMHHQSEDSSWATYMIHFEDAPCVTLTKQFDARELGQHESRTPSDRGYDADASSSETDSVASEFKAPFHHLNFFGKPVYHKYATPPATSLAILKSQRQGLLDLDKCMRKAVCTWNALHFLEPVVYWGPHETLSKYSGTTLKEAVTGQCGKIYTNDGMWLDDEWNEDEDQPFFYRGGTVVSDVLFNGQRSHGIAPSSTDFCERLQRSHEEENRTQNAEKRRERWCVKSRSRLYEVTCAADED